MRQRPEMAIRHVARSSRSIRTARETNKRERVLLLYRLPRRIILVSGRGNPPIRASLVCFNSCVVIGFIPDHTSERTQRESHNPSPRIETLTLLLLALQEPSCPHQNVRSSATKIENQHGKHTHEKKTRLLRLDLDGSLRSRENSARGVFCREGVPPSPVFIRRGAAATVAFSHDGVLGRALLRAASWGIKPSYEMFRACESRRGG